MRHGRHFCYVCLWVVAIYSLVCQAEHEFYERDEEAMTLVNCVHDSAPRFGKRICDCGYRNEVSVGSLVNFS